MSSINTAFIKKAQQLLSKHGFEVKTSQLYEIFSELSGYKNYNIAKAKNIEFETMVKIPEDAKALKDLALKIQEESYIPFHERIMKKIQKDVLYTVSKRGIEIYVSIDLQNEINLKKTSELIASLDNLERLGFHFYLKKMYKDGKYINEYDKTLFFISFFEDYKYILGEENVAVKCSAKELETHVLNFLNKFV